MSKCGCDSEACCQGSAPATESKIEGLTHLEAIDTLNDLINGVRHWKQTKLSASGAWDVHDEALARWIDASELELD